MTSHSVVPSVLADVVVVKNRNPSVPFSTDPSDLRTVVGDFSIALPNPSLDLDRSFSPSKLTQHPHSPVRVLALGSVTKSTCTRNRPFASRVLVVLHYPNEGVHSISES